MVYSMNIRSRRRQGGSFSDGLLYEYQRGGEGDREEAFQMVYSMNIREEEKETGRKLLRWFTL